MSLRVGINENVFLDGAQINDKGTLVISFRDGNAAPVDADDFLNRTAEVKAGGGVSNMMIFPPNVEFNGQVREVKQIADSLVSVRDQLEHILMGYVTSDQATLKPYDGVDISDSQAFADALKTQPTVTRIYNNLASQFVQKVQELKDQLPVKAFRLLLVRRSETNHYGTLRAKFISDNPFWESMLVPKNSSRLQFTKYEKGKGLDKGEPVDKAAADAVPVPGETSAAQALLGSR